MYIFALIFIYADFSVKRSGDVINAITKRVKLNDSVDFEKSCSGVFGEKPAKIKLVEYSDSEEYWRNQKALNREKLVISFRKK